MGLDDVVRALRARRALIGVLLLVGLALAAGLAALKTPVYKATSQVNISAPGAGNDISGQAAAIAKVPTLIQIVRSQRYLQSIIDQRSLKTTWQDLKANVAITNPAGTSLMDIEVSDSSAARATTEADLIAGGLDDHLADIKQDTIRSTVTAKADKPGSPASPKLALWLAIGGVLGLAVGTSLAIGQAARDTSVREDDDLAELFGLPLLGKVPLDPKGESQPLPVSVPGTGARAEALRQLRTTLQFLSLGDDVEAPRSILVTSAVGGEGKTTTACNVAIALAHAGLSTILVGADLRRTDLSRYMGVSEEVGLTSVLGGWNRLDEALHAWGGQDDRLWVLGAGPTPPNPSELLASEQMQVLLRDLESRADIVIIDGAPLLPVADSAALAAIVSGTLLVIASDRTAREQVVRALSTLRQLDAQVFGGVLNRTVGKAKEGSGYLPPDARRR